MGAAEKLGQCRDHLAVIQSSVEVIETRGDDPALRSRHARRIRAAVKAASAALRTLEWELSVESRDGS